VFLSDYFVLFPCEKVSNLQLQIRVRAQSMVCVHTYSESDNAFQRLGNLKLFKMVAGRHLGFDPTGNGAVRSAVPENPTLEPNMKGIG